MVLPHLTNTLNLYFSLGYLETVIKPGERRHPPSPADPFPMIRYDRD